MDSRYTQGIAGRASSAAKRVLLAFVCLVIAPIAGIWVGVQFPNPPGNGPGVWQSVFGGGVPVALALLAAALTQVRRLEALFWALAALLATIGLLGLIAYLVAQVD